MMFKKAMAILLGAAMTAGMMAGCSGGGSAAPAENSAAGGAESTASSASAAAPADDGKQITLSVFDAHAYGLDEYAKMVEAYQADHPNIKIEVQHAANDSDSLLKARFNSNDIPDVFDVQTGTVARSYYEYAYDWTNDADVIALFNEDAINTGKDDEGNVKSLPWTYENMGLIYNKDLFDKAGITEVPTTITALEDACKKMDSAGITSFALAAKESWVLAQLSTHFMMDKSKDAAGVVSAISDGTLTYDAMPNYKNLFKLLDLAVQYGPEKPLEIDWETSENMLANGQAAIIHMGDWCQATLDSFNPDANLAFLPCPVGDNPDDTTLLSSISWTYLVHNESENLDAAKEYLVYLLTSENGLSWMCDTVGNVPGCKTDKTVKGALANDAAAYINAGKTNGWIHTIMPQGYTDQIGPMFQSYMLGQTSAEDTISAVQSAWAA